MFSYRISFAIYSIQHIIGDKGETGRSNPELEPKFLMNFLTDPDTQKVNFAAYSLTKLNFIVIKTIPGFSA